MATQFLQRLFFAVLTSSSAAFACPEATIVSLTPPLLDEQTVLREVTCTRPMREGRFNISTEVRSSAAGDQRIVHCYGHGGSGWTTLFGSVKEGIRLLQEADPRAIDKPIRVIGSGCMGLTAAIELSRLGYRVSGISTKELYDLCSWRAAGYFALVSVKTSPEEQENLNRIGEETFKTYREIEQGTHPYIASNAVRYIPVYCGEDTESGVEDLEAKGLIPPHEQVTLDFGHGVRHENFRKYMTYFMDTTQLMKQLTREVERLGVPIDLETVSSFDDVEEEVVFNCSGIAARELNGDAAMIPVRGHLVLLNEQAGTEHMDYMIYTKVHQDGKEEYIYMFPKSVAVSADAPEGIPCKAVLGGTFIPHADRLAPEELNRLDETEFQKMLDRNALFFQGEVFSSKKASVSPQG